MKVLKQKYKINEVIKTSHGSYIIIDYYKKEYIENGKKRSKHLYKCRCLKDKYEFERTENQIDKKIGCPVCSSKKIIYGINSLADIRPDLMVYFVDKELPKMVAPCSNKYVDLKCPYCGYIVRGNIGNLYRVGFSCPICSDGISFPNKYIRSFLKQLDIQYEVEKIFDWGKQYKYDQYISQYNMIIENDGEQHFKTNAWDKSRDEKKIDISKEQLAFENNIKYFIRIDCRLSNGDYIKKNIMNSELPMLFHFTEEDINWKICEDEANSKITHKIWELWNNGTSAYEIMEKLNISEYMVREYINRGYEIGLCQKKCYLKKEKRDIKGNNDNHLFCIKPLYCEEDNSYYISSAECARVNVDKHYDYKSVSRAVKKGITYKGNHFKYISKEKYNELKLLSLTDTNIKVYGELLDKKYL